MAIRTAFLSLQDDPAPAARLAARVDERARGLGLLYVPIETVQDIVQEELVLGGHMRVAERYIVYRAERALLRAREEPPAAPAAEADDLRRRIAFASIGLDLDMDADELAQELRRSTHAGMHDADLRRLVVLNAKALVERDSELSRFAGRILLTYIYEETLGWDVRRDGRRRAARARTRAGCDRRWSTASRSGGSIRGCSTTTSTSLAEALDPSADLDFDFLGIQTLYDRYLIVDKTGASAAAHRDPAVLLDARRDGAVPRRAAGSGGPSAPSPSTASTRAAASARPRPRSSTPARSTPSCPPATSTRSTTPSSRSSERGIAENAMCSKWAGGLGGSWTAVRGTGSHIEGTNGASQGVIPFLKLHNDQLVAVNQGGKRAAPAAPTSRPGTTTSRTSSSCARTPATSAGAPTT